MTAITQTSLADRGRKHRCAECGAAFYDLQRNLTACPKCEAPYAAAPTMPTGAPGGARKRKWTRQAPAAAEPEDAAAAKDKDDADGVPMLDDTEEAEDTDAEVETEADAEEAEESEKAR